MLSLKRKDGQWVTITHKNGDTLRLRVYDVKGGQDGPTGSVRLAFDDDARNFEVDRPEGGKSERGNPSDGDGLAGGRTADRPVGSSGRIVRRMKQV
jgi:hypothetical protein